MEEIDKIPDYDFVPKGGKAQKQKEEHAAFHRLINKLDFSEIKEEPSQVSSGSGGSKQHKVDKQGHYKYHDEESDDYYEESDEEE